MIYCGLVVFFAFIIGLTLGFALRTEEAKELAAIKQEAENIRDSIYHFVVGGVLVGKEETAATALLRTTHQWLNRIIGKV